MLSFRTFITEAFFSGNDITKRDGEYLDLVISRIKEGKPFAFKDKNSEPILYDDNVQKLESMENPVDLLKSGSRFSKFFTTLSGKKYAWNEIEKAIFTGKIDRLRKEKDATAEMNAIIADAIDQYGGPIDVKIGRYNLSRVIGAERDHIKGDPKADITLIDENRKDVGFISLKADSGAKAFQQYGGITEKSGRHINQNKHVGHFAVLLRDALESKYGDHKLRNGDSFYYILPRDRDTEQLVGLSVYGKDWNKGKSFGLNSVHCIGQGSPILIPLSDNSYELKFQNGIHYANDLSWAFSGEYQATLVARYTGERRGLTSKNIRISNVRAGLFTYDYAMRRRAIELK